MCPGFWVHIIYAFRAFYVDCEQWSSRITGYGRRLRGALCQLFLFQDAVGDLADEGFGQLVAELDGAGHGVLRDVLGAIAHQRLTGLVVGGDAGSKLDERFDFLHPVGIGNADDAGHLDHIIRIEDVLNLTGINIVAGGNDHALGTAAEVNEAFLVHRAEVAGVDPCETVVVMTQGLRSLFGVLHVFLHYSGTGEQNLALRAVGNFFIGARFDDLDVGVRERNADASLLEHVRRGQTACCDGLGGAVALTHRHGCAVGVEEFIQFLLQLNTQAVAAGKYALERTEVRAIHARQTQQRLVERGHTCNEVAAVFGDEFRVALGGEARHEDAASALGEHGVDTYAEAEAVEERHGSEHLVAGVEHRIRHDDLLAQRIEVLVRQYDALGSTGGAAGIENDSGIVAGAFDGVIPEACLAHVHEILPANDRCILRDLGNLASLGEHIACADGLGECILYTGDDNIDDTGVLTDVLELIVKLVQRDGGNALGLVEVELDLLFRREGVDHVCNATDEIDGIEHIDSLRAVGHGDGDLVALTYADGLEGAGTFPDLLNHLVIGGGLAHEVERDVLGILLGNQLQCLKHGAFKIIQMQWHVAGMARPRGSGSDLSHSLPPDSAAARATLDVRAGAVRF